MTNFFKKYKFHIIAAINTLVLVIYALLVSGLYYETNDDATLSNIANGAFCSNTQDLIYINICFSYLLKFLNHLFPSINFVVIIQLFFVIASIYFIILLLNEKFGILQGIMFSCILFLPFATELISKFQYVKTSTIIITAGLILIATNLSKKNLRTVIGFALTTIGCQIRFESFIAAGALCAFTLLYFFFELSDTDKIKAALQMVLLFAIVFSLEFINSYYYRTNPLWREFTNYNEARTELSDYKENYIPVYFNDVMNRGFSENDVQMLYTRNYFDNSFFTTDVITKASAAVGAKPIKNIIMDYLHIVINLVQLLGEKFYRLGFVFAIILFITSNRKSKVYQFFTLAIFAGLLLYLMIVNRYMSRIEAMLIIALTINILIVYNPAKNKIINLSRITVFIMIFLIIFNMPVQLSYRKNKYYSYTETSQKYEDIIIEMSNNKENLYLFDPLQTSYFAGYDVFSPREENFFSNICPTGSWYSNSVYTNTVLENFEMESPLIDSVNKLNVYISNENIEIKLKYVQEHYNENVYAVKVTENGVCDYQFRLD